MSLQTDLLDQAARLASWDAGRPKQASLRRAISAAYYALFHHLIDEAVSRLLPANRLSLRNSLRRAFDHAAMREACIGFAAGRISDKLVGADDLASASEGLRFVAKVFLRLQQSRHDADYNVGRRFSRNEALDSVDACQKAFAKWEALRGSAEADVFLVALLALKQMRS
jgi:uncharacterized protein (UPF0332 family)